ncbi:MAG TPA: TIGR00341 family protein [Deltaproteobacteria bacterium]|nr:TIGR00341 family protein [Deltaproteobacteria bacterium]
MKFSTKILRTASRYLKIDDEVRFKVYTSTVQGTMLANIPYWVELILASGIATLGLVLNSPAIVIGAMLVSPLMTPIMGTGLALATGDFFLGIRAIANLLLSIGTCLAVSTLLVMLLPFKESTQEILARTQPNLLDLIVALLSGLAGSIATLKSSKGLTSALPGTAIAVALVPPLCVIGYGLGSHHFELQWWSIAKGGGLLFAANLVAIVLTSMGIFLLVGMGRRHIRSRVDEWQRLPEQFSQLEAWLEKSKIWRTMEKIGTLQARFVILMIFFFLVFFPLQQALTRVVAQIRERSERQQQVRVIHEVAQNLFNVPKTSEVEKIDMEPAAQGIRALIRVSTNRLFNKEERQKFEDETSGRLKKNVSLILIQSPGFFGEEKETDWSKFFALKTEAKAADPEETYRLMFDRIQSSVEHLWPEDAGQMLGMQLHLEENPDGEVVPVLHLTFLADSDLDANAKSIFRSAIHQSLSFEPQIRWEWVPSEYGPFSLTAGKTVLSEPMKEGLIQFAAVLKKFPQLEPEIYFSAPRRIAVPRRGLSSEAIRLQVSGELESQGIPLSHWVLREQEGGKPELRLSLKVREPEENQEKDKGENNQENNEKGLPQ